MEDTKSSSVKDILFIFRFMKKYWVGCVVVVLLLIAAAWFNVMSPKVMGEAVDKMSSYMISVKSEQMEQDILDGKGLSAEDKDNLLKIADLSTEQKDVIKNASNEELQTVYKQQNMINDVFYNYENNKNGNVIAGDGLMDEQIKTIRDSDVSEEMKQQLIGMNQANPLYFQKQYVLHQGGYSSTETDTINSSNDKKEIEHLFNIVGYRNYVLKLDESSIKNGVGLSNGQKSFMEGSFTANGYRVTQEDIDNILVLSPEELEKLDSSITTEMNKTESQKEFHSALVLLFITYILTAISMLLYNLIMSLIASKSTEDMRNALFMKLEGLSIRYFDQSNDGDLLSRFINDIDNIATFLNQSFVQIVSQFTVLIGIIIVMFQEDQSLIRVTVFGEHWVLRHFLVWIMLIFAAVAIFSAYFLIVKAKKYLSQQQERLGDLNGYIDERISGQKVIITYGLEDQTLAQFDEYNDEFRDVATKGQIYSGVLAPYIQGIGFLNLAVLVFLGAGFVSDGVMKVGLLTTFIQYSQRFFNPLAQIVSQYNLVELAITGAARVREVFEEKPEVVDTPGAKPIDHIHGKVVLQDVSFGYYADQPVLKNINIEVDKGKMIALVGPTGSGKTTVMNLMNRFYDVTSGDIIINDMSIKDITLETLRRNVGIVLQESVLFSGTVRDNIAYGKDDATDEEVITAAKTANIHEFIMTLENGYDTEVDNNTSAFSVGQKQLMSIARTILTNPDLLILDEATSNVDTVTEAKIQEAMENVLTGRTSFVIAHRLKTILNADEIIVLKDGEIIERGNHEELLAEDGFYSELYHNQFVLD